MEIAVVADLYLPTTGLYSYALYIYIYIYTYISLIWYCLYHSLACSMYVYVISCIHLLSLFPQGNVFPRRCNHKDIIIKYMFLLLGSCCNLPNERRISIHSTGARQRRAAMVKTIMFHVEHNSVDLELFPKTIVYINFNKFISYGCKPVMRNLIIFRFCSLEYHRRWCSLRKYSECFK